MNVTPKTNLKLPKDRKKHIKKTFEHFGKSERKWTCLFLMQLFIKLPVFIFPVVFFFPF